MKTSPDLVLAFQSSRGPDPAEDPGSPARGKSCCDLIAREERGLCACDIERAVGLSQAAVSHHMGLLRRAGLVDAEKRGRWMFYRRNEAALAGIAETLAKAV